MILVWIHFRTPRRYARHPPSKEEWAGGLFFFPIEGGDTAKLRGVAPLVVFIFNIGYNLTSRNITYRKFHNHFPET